MICEKILKRQSSMWMQSLDEFSCSLFASHSNYNGEKL